MYDLSSLTEKIINIANEQGFSINTLLKTAGLSKSVLDNMKRNQNPSIDKIYIIAEHLNISLDYLTGRTTNREINK